MFRRAKDESRCTHCARACSFEHVHDGDSCRCSKHARKSNPVSSTPHHLRAWGMPADMPTRRLWRGPLAWAQQETRKYICGVLWLLQAAKCIEQVGDDPNWTAQHSQALLANMRGVGLSTMNRLINKVTAPDGRWDKPCASEKHTHAAGTITRRECWSQRKRQQANDKGLELRDHDINSVDRLITLFHKSKGGFGIVKVYELAMAAALRPKLKTRENKFEDAQNLAATFNPVCEACQGKDDKCPECDGSGYAEILFDPKARSFTENGSFNGHNDCDMQFYSTKMPDANPCECSLGQENLEFQKDCPHCAGKGYVIGRKLNRKTGEWEFARLDDITRDVATYLQLKGIKDFPYLQLIQEKMAREMGIDANTFYKSRQKLEWLKYLKVVEGAILRECPECANTWWDERSKADENGVRKEEFCPRGCRDKKGPVKGKVLKRKPDKLIWLPNILLDPDVLARERELFIARLNDLQAARAGVSPAEFVAMTARQRDDVLQLANKTWNELHNEWSAQQHNLAAFWNELRRRLIAAGINKSVADALLPIYRE